MNSVFKSSKSTSEIQEEGLPTVLSSISKGFQNDKTHKVSDFKARGFMVATEYARSGSNNTDLKSKWTATLRTVTLAATGWGGPTSTWRKKQEALSFSIRRGDGQRLFLTLLKV